jgi:tetratricopeptide (TPR) repeat protein
LDDQQISLEFARANEAFRQANELAANPTQSDEAQKLYAKAALHYEKIITEGEIRNSKLYYNLGNAYLLKADLGRAILNYRRAQNLDASDPDIQKNLTFARSKRTDEVATEAQKKVMQTLFFWHYDFSMKVRFFVAALSVGLLFVSLTLQVWLGRTGYKPAFVAGSIIAFVIATFFITSVVIENLNEVSSPAGVILAESVIARQGDGANYLPSFKEPLHAGTEFELIEKRPGWMEIKLTDGSTAWILDSAAEIL